MRLSVYCDGSVVVTLPQGSNENIVERFLSEQQEWLLKRISFFRQFPRRRRMPSGKKNYRMYKERARELVIDRVSHFNKIYPYAYNKISIRNQKTRWGSCSHKGNLNFNYKILFLPETLRDYVIVHELCHLKEFNHSKRFWALVTQVIPNYSAMRKELRKRSYNQLSM